MSNQLRSLVRKIIIETLLEGIDDKKTGLETSKEEFAKDQLADYARKLIMAHGNVRDVNWDNVVVSYINAEKANGRIIDKNDLLKALEKEIEGMKAEFANVGFKLRKKGAIGDYKN